jgi:hypothetical protein
MPARKPKPRRRAARKPPAPVAAPAKPGQPPFVPTDQDRQLVRVMVSGGIEAWAICECLSRKISKGTLRKHFRREIATGAGEANAAVIASLHKMAVGQRARPAQIVNGVQYHAQSEIRPEVRAAQWWTQARMGWRETTEIANPPGEKLRVVVEFVGDAADTGARPAAGGDGKRASDAARKSVDLVG